MIAAGTDPDTDPEQMTTDRQGGVLYRWSFSYWLDGDEYLAEFWARDAEEARRHARALAHNRVLRGRVVSQGSARRQPMTDRHSTHHVHRGPESLPCYCAATSDHAIGQEQPPPPSSHVRLVEALRAAEPYVEICHSLISKKDTRTQVWKVLKQIRAALATTEGKDNG